MLSCQGAEADEHEQGLQHSTKANQLRGRIKRCKEYFISIKGATHPGQTFQGRDRQWNTNTKLDQFTADLP